MELMTTLSLTMLQPVSGRTFMVTLRQVAERAGVSIKTVSRIVNGDPAVNAKTRIAVQHHLQALNYVPNHAARMMRGGDSSVYGFMTDAVATTPYSVDLVRGAQTALKQMNKTLLIANTDGDPALERKYWQMFRAHRVDGVIYAAMFHRAHVVGEPDFKGSIVLANCFASSADRPSVIPDDEAGGYAQAEYLLKRGHRRIGLMTLISGIEATRLRGIGVRRAHQDAGVQFDESFNQLGIEGTVRQETMVAFEKTVEMLKRSDRPTAIICGNDTVATQVYYAAGHVGLKIPQDISIIGFDDQKLISENLRPSLTTVALPYFDIGRIAVETIRDAKENDHSWSPKILVPCPVVERESCRAIS
jgi:LacI family transcriptional regulator